MIMLVIKLLIPFGSLLGLIAYSQVKKEINIAFAPSISCAVVIFLLTVSGYINYLEECALIIYIIGWICLIYSIAFSFKTKTFFEKLLTPSFVFFCIFSLLCVIIYQDYIFIHPDEYNHWGIVIKEIVALDGFPNATTVVDCIEYTLSSSLFVYFFLNSTGFSQSICYMAQGFMVVAGLCVFWKDVCWKKPSEIIKSLMCSICILFVFSYGVQYLLVDHLIALYSGALIIITIEYFQHNDDIIEFFKYITPMAIASSFIKTSALIYWFVHIVVAFVLWARKGGKLSAISKEKIPQLVLFSFSPIFAFLLWIRNVDKLYLSPSAYSESKFSFTLENLRKTYFDKPAAMRKEITMDWLTSIFTKNISLIIVICFILTLFMLLYYNRKNEDISKVKIFFAVSFFSWFIFFLGYGFSLLFMFPKNEFVGVTLIAYTRYMSTATGLSLVLIVYALLERKIGFKFSAQNFVIVGIVIVLCTLGYSERIFVRDVISTKEYNSLVEFQNTMSNIPRVFSREDQLLCYTGEYLDDCSRYNDFSIGKELQNNNIYNFSDFTIEGGEFNYIKLNYYISQSDYIVVLNNSEVIYEHLKNMKISIDEPDGKVYEINMSDEGNWMLLKKG